MYYLHTVEGKVRIPPEMLSMDRKEAVLKILKEKYEGTVDEDLGVVVAITGVEEVGEGVIIPGDAGVYFDARYKVLTYMPKLQEVVEGFVTDITEFGAFVRIGPMDGLVHVSQVMDDFIQYDPGQPAFIGKESKKKLVIGDVVRARIVSVSMKSNLTECKVGLTMRQPGLGKGDWREEA